LNRINSLRSTIEEFKTVVNLLRGLNLTSRWSFTLAAYFHSIVELGEGICILYDSKSWVAIPIVFRSFLEAIVDFTNLASDKSYGYNLDTYRIKEWSKLLDSTNNDQSLTEISEDDEWVSFLRKITMEKQELGDKFKITQKKENFEKAGYLDVYNSLYNDLCSDSHNNLRSVYVRFMGDESMEDKSNLCVNSIHDALYTSLSILENSFGIQFHLQSSQGTKQ
jgi:hypothetical protein